MNEKITLPALVQLLAIHSGDSRKQSEEFIKELFTIVSSALEEGDNVKIKNLGVFKTVSVGARKSVNVATGEQHEIPSHHKVVFTPTKDVAAAVNEPFEMFETVELNEIVPPSEKHTNNSESKKEEVSPVLEPDIKDNVTQTSETESEKYEDESNHLKDFDEEKEEVQPSEYDDEIEEVTIVITEEELISESPSVSTETKKVSSGRISTGKNDITDSDKVAWDGHTLNRSQTGNDFDDDTKFNEEDDDFVLGEEKNEISSSNLKASHLPAYHESDEKDDLEAEKNDTSNHEYQSKRFGMGFTVGFICAASICCLAFFLIYFLGNLRPEQGGKTALSEINEDSLQINVKEEITIDTGIVLAQEEPNEIESQYPTDVNEGVKNEEINQKKVEESKEEVKESEPPVPTVPSDEKTYDVITKTRYLTTMAKDHYGNYHLWPYIYMENQKMLGHPDRIKPGTKVIIPALSKYGVNPKNKNDIEKAKKKGIEIYSRYK